jgi:hypothetical protein
MANLRGQFLNQRRQMRMAGQARQVESARKEEESRLSRVKEFAERTREQQLALMQQQAEEIEVRAVEEAKQRTMIGGMEKKLAEAFGLERKSRVDLRTRFLAEMIIEMFGERAVKNPALARFIFSIMVREFGKGSDRIKSNPDLLEAFRQLKGGSRDKAPRQLIAQAMQEILQEHQGELAKFGVAVEG